MKRTLAFHPILFGLAPVVFLYQNNVNQVPPSQILPPLLAMLAGTAAISLVLWALRDDGRRAVIASWLIVCVLSYVHVRIWASSFVGRALLENRHDWFLYLWIGLMVLGSVLILRVGRHARALTSFCNAASVVLFLFPALHVSVYWLALKWPGLRRTAEIKRVEVVTQERPAYLPDIYYIIPDRYASASILKEQYHFGNKRFVSYLKARGFMVVPKARSNYPKTGQSITSSLNMLYLDGFVDKMGRNSEDWLQLFAILQNHTVGQFLKSMGYRFYHLGGWWEPTSRNRFADVNLNLYDQGGFGDYFLRTSLLSAWSKKCENYRDIDFLVGRHLQHDRILYEMDRIAEIPSINGPTFTVAHLLIPHDPYVFDSTGAYQSWEQAEARGDDACYVAQVKFCNKLLMNLIDTILAKSEKPPIIVIQADEGPRPARYKANEDGFDWRTATRDEVKRKMRILNAYYLPGITTPFPHPKDTAATPTLFGSDKLAPYDSITPVNTFRLIFDRYLGANLPLLPDRSYAFSDAHHIYDFFDVTDSLR